jgi:flavin-dependent dehydrogenase
MTEGSFYDVVIIGGGLAGLSLAILCADQNYKVAVFEKETYPFHKVCGEYISLESEHFLERLGLDLKRQQLPVIKKLQVSNARGTSYSFHLPLGGFGISRFLLDDSLSQIAQAKGVKLVSNTKVGNVSFDNDAFTVAYTGGQTRAKIVAGAYGKRSNLDIKWNRTFTRQKANGLNNYIGIKYHVKYVHDPATIALHNFFNGYCGLSKIEDDKSCLCYLTTAQNLKDCGNSIRQMEEKVLFENPRLKEIFSSATFLYDEPLTISQISFASKSLVQDHVLMIGDSAGMISPLCGNGMSMAMHSAALASGCIKEYLSGKFTRQVLEKTYETRWNKEFSMRVMIGRTVQRFFGGKISTSIFLKTMDSFPPLATMLIRSTHGTTF